MTQLATVHRLRPLPHDVATGAALTFESPAGFGFAGLDLRATGGTVLAVHGGPARRRTALLLALSGRLPLHGGLLVVGGEELFPRPRATRARTGLAEIPGVTDLDDRAPLDERAAEAIAEHRVLPWAPPARVRRLLGVHAALLRAAGAGTVAPRAPIGTLDPLQRKLFGLTLALAGRPSLILAGDADGLASAADRAAYWRAAGRVAAHRTDAEGRPVAVVAGCREPDEALAALPGDRLRLLELERLRRGVA